MDNVVIAKGLKTPFAASLAGILFSLLLAASFVLIKLAVPFKPEDAGAWITDDLKRTYFLIVVNLIPFAGIAFFWFIGVIRDRMGSLEDKFFASIFFGSGVVFVATLFIAAAIITGMLSVFNAQPATQSEKDLWGLLSRISFVIMSTFAMRVAAVFTISTSMVGLRTGIFSRWLSMAGFFTGIVILIAGNSLVFVNILFPLWTLSISIEMLFIDITMNKRSKCESGKTV